MKNLFVLKSSLFNGAGQSSHLADTYIGRWQERNPEGNVVVRDLARDPVPHLTQERFQGFLSQPAERTEAQQAAVALSDTLIGELQAADEIVLALPMYNFTVPSTFKAYMDHIARAGVTFKYTETGPVGLLGPKSMVVLATRGGGYAGTEKDTQTPLIKMFFGMLGITDIQFVYAEGLALGEESSKASIAKAKERILSLMQ